MPVPHPASMSRYYRRGVNRVYAIDADVNHGREEIGSHNDGFEKWLRFVMDWLCRLLV